jgi:dihydroflavonol-4-reductase
MEKILVTGAVGFLGYHAVRLLNERGHRPRVLLSAADRQPSKGLDALRKQDVVEVSGGIDDPASLAAACDGVDTVLHLEFSLKLSSGPEVEKTLHEVNVVGSRSLLDAATKARVQRVVMSSSSLSVGLAREPKPLDEWASWDINGLSLPYARSRREAEQEALARPAGPGLPVIVTVNPTFTLGPYDYSGAPANSLVKLLAKPFPLDAAIGFSILDVRDYADGVLRAAEQGQHGRRYLLSGDNLMARDLLLAVSKVTGKQAPGWRFTLRSSVVSPLLALVELQAKLMNKPPAVTRAVLELFGRYAWYDTKSAREELGWKPRSLQDSLHDSLAWLASQESPQARGHVSTVDAE